MRSRWGLRPTRPQLAAGMRIEPRPSEAVAAAHRPAATAAALPPLEPPALRSVFQGLRVTPNAGPSVSPMMASSGRFVLPMITAPAARRRAMNSLSRAAGAPGSAVPQAVGSPATSSVSLTAIGTPSSGRSSPAPRRASACSGVDERPLAHHAAKGVDLGLEALDPRAGRARPARARTPRRRGSVSAWRAAPAKARSSSVFIGAEGYPREGRPLPRLEGLDHRAQAASTSASAGKRPASSSDTSPCAAAQAARARCWSPRAANTGSAARASSAGGQAVAGKRAIGHQAVEVRDARAPTPGRPRDRRQLRTRSPRAPRPPRPGPRPPGRPRGWPCPARVCRWRRRACRGGRRAGASTAPPRLPPQAALAPRQSSSLAACLTHGGCRRRREARSRPRGRRSHATTRSARARA